MCKRVNFYAYCPQPFTCCAYVLSFFTFFGHYTRHKCKEIAIIQNRYRGFPKKRGLLAYNNKQHPAAYQAASFGTQALRRDKQRINTDSDTYSRTTSSHTTKAALPCQANQQNNQGCKVFRATTCGGQRCSIYLSLTFLLLALLLWLLVRLKQHHRQHKPLTTHGHDDCSFFTREYHRDRQ